MHVLKKIILGVCVVLFGPAMALLGMSIAFNQTIGQPTFVKQVLREAQLYSTLSELAIDHLQLDANNQQTGLITQAMQETITPDVVQNNLEQILDDVYAWLDQDTPTLKISINIQPIRDSFVANLRPKLSTELASLPECTYANPPTSSDPLSANCLPPGTDVNAVVEQAIQQIINSGEILQQNEISSQDLDATFAENNTSPSGDTEASAQEPAPIGGPALEQGATLYRLAKNSLPYLAGIAIITGIGVFFLSKTRLRGLRKISGLLLANGILLVILAVGTQALATTLVPEAAQVNGLSDSAELTARIIVTAYAVLLRNFAVVISVVGLAGVIASSIAISKLEPKQPKAETVHKQLKQDHLPNEPKPQT